MKNKLTKDQQEVYNKSLDSLKESQKLTDIETAHWQADIALCAFLESLGFEELVKEFDKIDKYYA